MFATSTIFTQFNFVIHANSQKQKNCMPFEHVNHCQPQITSDKKSIVSRLGLLQWKDFLKNWPAHWCQFFLTKRVQWLRLALSNTLNKVCISHLDWKIIFWTMCSLCVSVWFCYNSIPQLSSASMYCSLSFGSVSFVFNSVWWIFLNCFSLIIYHLR